MAAIRRVAKRRGVYPVQIDVEMLDAIVAAKGRLYDVKGIDPEILKYLILIHTYGLKITFFERACRFLDKLDDLLLGDFRRK